MQFVDLFGAEHGVISVIRQKRPDRPARVKHFETPGMGI
jgi:hypothetical protein